MVSTPVFQIGNGVSITLIGFDKNKNFCYNIIKEVAERKLFNLIKNKQNCWPYLSAGRIGNEGKRRKIRAATGT